MQSKTVFINTLIIVVTLVRSVHTANRTFTCGIINGYSVEYEAVNFTVSNTSILKNVSIIVKHFNISDNFHLFNQASAVIQQNVAVFFEGSRTETPACAVSRITGIPLIRLHGDSRPFEQCEKAVQMSAGYRDYAHASLDILNTFRWKNIALVFDEDRLHEAGYFHAISRKSELTVNLVQLSEQGKTEDRTATNSKAMDEIKILQPDIILLYTSKENIKLILQQKPCQYKKGYKWILQGQVPIDLSSSANNVVVAMKLPYVARKAFSNTNKEFVARVYDSVQVLHQALNTEPCSLINRTVISSKDRDDVLTCIKKVDLDGLTGSVQFNENGNRKGINLEILNLRNNSFKNVGTWNSSKGTVMFGNILRNVMMSSSGGTLEGRKLRVVVIEAEPFVVKKQEGDTISYDGYCIDLLKELASILKFTYELYPSPDGYYGTKTANGSWNGMVGELVKEQANIIVAPLTVNEAREKVVDFTIPYMFYTNDMLMKKPSSKEKTDLLQFMSPYHNNVWFCTLATLVIISVAVYVINYFSPYGYKDENGRGTSEEFSYINSLWFAVACMLQQGGDNTPRSLSGRILSGCYWFCILIWVSTYTANLAAFFTVKNAEQSINNLEDLAKSSYDLGVLDSGSTYAAFKRSQYETHQKLWRRMQAADSFPKNVSQAIQWVREREKFVFMMDSPTLRRIANQPPCDLKTVPGMSAASAHAFALQANDPHTMEITLAILRLQESNFLDNLHRKWWESSNACHDEEDTTLSRKQIGLTSMLGVYVVLGVGMFIAFVTLIAEIYWKKRVKQNLINKFRRCRTKISALKGIEGNN